MNDDLFDPQPDAEIGHLLRQHLAAADPESFGARLRAAVAAARPSSAWDVLAGWALPGLAAAALILLTLGMLLGRGPAPADALEQALELNEAPAELVAAAYSRSPDVVLGAAMED